MNYNSQIHKSAVVSHGSALYGVGIDDESAIYDAAEWIETNERQQGNCTTEDVKKLLNHGMGPRVNGQFYLIHDSDEIKRYVENQ